MREKSKLVSATVAKEKLDKADQDLGVAGGELYRLALAMSDGYWVAIKEEAFKREAFFRYGVRVKQRVYGVSIEWMKGMPMGGGEERRLRFRSLPRGPGLSYRRSTFEWAKPWEMVAIMKAESEFAFVRDASDRVADAGRRLGWVKKVVERRGEIESRRLREVLLLVDNSCGAVREVARADLAAETECVS
jgi:hypothetical protein